MNAPVLANLVHDLLRFNEWSQFYRSKPTVLQRVSVNAPTISFYIDLETLCKITMSKLTADIGT